MAAGTSTVGLHCGVMRYGSGESVLVAGGAGYIGSHTVKALHQQGYRPVVYDNLSSGFREAAQWGTFIHGDIRDERALTAALRAHDVKAVIHFAGLIEVGRSMARPDIFWEHNVLGTATLLNAMRESGAKRLVFSSSAAVYGQAGRDALDLIDEAAPKDPSSPYGDTKLACERMIMASCNAFGLSAVALRYFNAAGADPSGMIGESHEPETHLIPLAIAAALGESPPLTVFGEDFETPDGTCLRDYVHVNDLAKAHICAIEAELSDHQFEAFNLGGGEGRSVRDVIAAVGHAVGRPVPYSVGARRPGDPPSLVANAERAAALLGWRPTTSSLEQIVRDAVRWEADPAYGVGRRRRLPAVPPAKVA